MRYADRQEVWLGDRVALGEDRDGVVVCSIDSGQGGPGYPVAEWAYLEHGALVKFPRYGLIHYSEPEEDLVLIERADANAAGMTVVVDRPRP